MAGKPASPFGAAVRELILAEQESGENPTWKTIGDKVKKIAQENKDKRNDKDLSIAFNQIKQQLKKKSGAAAPKKRGRPPKAASVTANGAVKKSNGKPVSFGSFELAIKFAQEAGGLDAAISTLHQLKAIKESI